jgi:cytoskeletal protein CcmA (bactofilin family)
MSNQININGVTYYGNSITIKNNKVIVDGDDVSGDFKIDQPISITGNIENLTVASADVKVSGDVESIKTQSGDVDVFGNVSGNVSTQSGDIKVKGNITGNAKTMSGDIKYRK